MKFDHRSLEQRVRFGAGDAAKNVTNEVMERQAKSVMVIAALSERALAAEVTSAIDVKVEWDEVLPHVPSENAERAREVSRNAEVDLLVAVGGGSTIGLAKAIALTESIPIVAVPTTYAGSEATNVWGLTTNSRKTTGVDDIVLPEVVVYDAELTLSLPVELSVASGLNAIAHCVDSMWAPLTDPINRALAEEGIRSVARALPLIVTDPVDLIAREQLQYGAYVSAVAFASAGSGLHHKICHVLGGKYDLPHAQTHSAILPQVLAFNSKASTEAETRIARALNSETAASGVESLYRNLPAVKALSDVGYRRASIPESVDLILPLVPKTNPRIVGEAELTGILSRAYEGASIA